MRDAGTNWLIPDNAPAGTWAALTTWDAWERWPNAPYGTLIYEEVPLDLGAVYTFAPSVAVVAEGTVSVQESHSSDGTTWTSWGALPRFIAARYLKVRVTVSGVFPILKDLQVFAVGKPRTQTLTNLDTAALTGSHRLGVGDIHLPVAGFTAIEAVTLTFQNVGGRWGYEIIDKNTATGPRLKLYNAAGALADATIDAIVQGY